MGRAIQHCAPRDDMIVNRFTCDILGAIPVGDVEVAARVVRPGRSVEVLEAVATVGGARWPGPVPGGYCARRARRCCRGRPPA